MGLAGEKTTTKDDAVVLWIAAVAEARDKKAFESIFRHYAPRLKSWLLSQQESPEAAEEIIQETLCIVWRQAQQYSPARASVATWIYTIARNVRRARYRCEILSLQETEIEDENTLPSPEEALEIDSALGHLPPEQFTILKDTFFNGLTQEEIALKQQIPLGTVKSRTRLALKKMRALLTLLVCLCMSQLIDC